MKLNIKNMICGLGLMVLATSCDNFLDVHPKGEIVGKDLLSERKGFENALYGVYASMRNDKAYGAYMTYYVMDVLAQYFNCPGNSDITDLSAFKYKENPEVTKVFSDIWSTMYQNISYANNILVNLENQSPETLEFYDIYKGEALGLRAYMHFDLLRLYADQATDAKTRGIVYNTAFSLKPSDILPKTKVYERIIADLRAAEKLLDNEKLYEAASPEDGFFLDQSIHFNLQAARATLARVYLTQGNIDSAFYYADKVIREGGLELVEKTEIAGDVIGALSQKETIFGLYAKESFYTRTKEDLYDAVSFKSLNPWNGIATVYQQGGGENDYRWAAWFQTISNNLRFVKLTDPYQLSTGNNRPAGQIPGVNLIRLPEMYYIAAECLLRKNDPKAADYFNAVLESRGLVALDDRIPAESLTIEKITQERYKEFVGEGQTFFNMKRLNLDIQAITGEILPAA
ncbi:MAG TPA: hypothetical protein DEQ93_01240, partial [Odoribacter splanchnicus]|nr:hypothetical protein [Odoribacter splanchnicus]